jgi:hypothetical protein
MTRWLALLAAAAVAWTPALADETEAVFAINPAAIDDLAISEITPCNGRLDWSPSLKTAEEARAIAANPSVRRTGKRLRIGRATYVSRIVDPDADNGIEYAFIGRYRAAPLVLISITQYETFAWSLVDPATGEHAEAASLPLPAPGGHSFASATRSDGYNEPGLDIIEWRDGHVTTSSVAAAAAYPCDLKWEGPDTLSLRLRVGETSEWRVARVVRKDGEWVLQGP